MRRGGLGHLSPQHREGELCLRIVNLSFVLVGNDCKPAIELLRSVPLPNLTVIAVALVTCLNCDWSICTVTTASRALEKERVSGRTAYAVTGPEGTAR